MRRFLYALGLFCLLLTGGGGYLYWDAQSFLRAPANEALGDVQRFFYLTVKPGQSFDQVAAMLRAEGGISDELRFRLYGRLRKVERDIKAGDFEFNNAWTPAQVLDQLVSGRTLLHRVTIPEGRPWWEVARILAQNGFVAAEQFEEVIKDSAFLRRYGIPFDSAEGFLFPETYTLPKPRELTRAQAETVASTMVSTFWRQSAHLWEAEASLYQLSPALDSPETAAPTPVASVVPEFARQKPDEVKRLVIMASLVEKESAVPEERPRVAGVYANRLRLRMALQCDPTVIYGLGPGFQGRLLRSHLEDKGNTYNTYQNPGLPPSPICSPGLSAMAAAMEPEAHKYLYFVATGRSDGRHVFSKTLEEHNKAVQAYRRQVGR